jgi:signal transduction histidine kinase
MEQVDTAAVVHDILAALAPPAGFTITCVDPMPVIRTQRAPLERVLAALIGNAVQHHDGAQGHITVAARCNAGLAEFRVTDDGPGIGLPPPDRPEADGIGLAIVRRTVGSHGGEIRVETAPPARGTSIVFTWKEAAA